MSISENKILRIIIFDDHKDVRDSVEVLLSTTLHLEFTAGFESCNHLIKEIEVTRPDVVLMDIDMPFMNGIDAVKLLRTKFPDLPVLMLTGFEDDEKVFDSICAGANGYVLKNANMESLLQYINEVYSGGAPMTPVIARKVLDQFSKLRPSKAEHDEFNSLSSREKVVLNLLVKGKSYKMIANELFVSFETVHSHVSRIYRKLHVNSVAGAVSKTISKGY
ncbi:MAG: response regulator transcription factor [Chitinophagaceae bacterium]|nr:response regulator transcription factor [Chitinophagaceae bacterium]